MPQTIYIIEIETMKNGLRVTGRLEVAGGYYSVPSVNNELETERAQRLATEIERAIGTAIAAFG